VKESTLTKLKTTGSRMKIPFLFWAVFGGQPYIVPYVVFNV